MTRTVNPDALADSKAALKLDPDNVLAINNQAVALAKMGRTKEALDSLARALTLAQTDEVRAHITMFMDRLTGNQPPS